MNSSLRWRVPVARHSRLSRFKPRSDSVYIFSERTEERSLRPQEWREGAEGVEFLRVTEWTDWQFRVEGIRDNEWIPLRAREDLESVWPSTAAAYLDITGLPGHVWAPVLRSLLLKPRTVYCVYAMPAWYQESNRPTEADVFDLSSRIDGIRPIPGFASLPLEDTPSLLVALLGFEGTRFAYLRNKLDPDARSIIPVVGCPGYRPEYVAYAYECNRRTLRETRSWSRVRYAGAACPFGVYLLLEELMNSAAYRDRALQVGLIGTKPHALGAVLYHFVNGRDREIELVYDHPRYRDKRTTGEGPVVEYEVSAWEPVRLLRDDLGVAADVAH